MIHMVQTIAVLSGGFSCEREISLMSGKAVKSALDSLSYKAIEIDVDSDVARNIKKINPSLAFIALHGPYGEDGCIQGLLEILGIKYTHSKVMASAIAMNKMMSKHIFHSLNIDTPSGYIINRENLLKNNVKIGYPYVLKPISEGSSIGVKMIFSHEDYLELQNNSFPAMEKVIVEEYIPGVELHTAVLLTEAIGTIEIRPKNRFYDYEAKYTNGFTEHIFPPEIPENIYKNTLKYALRVHQFLECKTISRSDFIYDTTNNTIKMLEINTHPGLTELSLVPKIAKLTKGINFNNLIKIIVEDSLHLKNIRDQDDNKQCY